MTLHKKKTDTPKDKMAASDNGVRSPGKTASLMLDTMLRTHPALAPSKDQMEPAKAVLDIIAERRRQIEVEDFDACHDDMATRGQLAGAAACYAMTGIEHWARDQAIKTIWPWDIGWWKPTDRRRDLVKAAALIIAEIERLDRAAAKEGSDRG